MSAHQFTITCSMCGHTFDPAEQAPACQACPLHAGCSLVRCPVCGFETVNPAQSRLATLFTRIFPPKSPTPRISPYDPR